MFYKKLLLDFLLKIPIIRHYRLIAAEDFTTLMMRKCFGKNINRQPTNWTQDVIAEALDRVSSRRDAVIVLITPAAPSQINSGNGCLLAHVTRIDLYCDGVL